MVPWRREKKNERREKANAQREKETSFEPIRKRRERAHDLGLLLKFEFQII